MKILFLGPPGAGKGTQAVKVAEHFGIAHVSTGDMFRALSDETELGRRVLAIMASGELVPDETTIEMLEERISQDDAQGGYILDGFPRTLAQAEALDANLGDESLDHIVVLDVDEEELVQRLVQRGIESGRADDNEDSIRVRLGVYSRDTEPLIAHYEPRGIVRRIDGVGDIDDITAAIVSAIANA